MSDIGILGATRSNFIFLFLFNRDHNSLSVSSVLLYTVYWYHGDVKNYEAFVVKQDLV